MTAPEDHPARRKRRPLPPPEPIIVETRAPRRGASCGFFAGLSLLVVVVVAGIVILAFTNRLTGFMDDPLDNTLELLGIDRGQTEPEVIDARVVVLGIQNLALLETTRGDILVDETVVQEKTFVLRDARLRVQYAGRVTAGLDLSRLGEQDVVVEMPDRVTINLPPAQITGCYLRDPEIIENTCGTNLLGMADCSATYERLQRTAYERARVDLLETAQELDVLTDAIESAESAIAGLLRDLGFEEITFNRSTETLPPDDSCVAP